MNNEFDEKQDFHDWAISKGWYLYCKQPELWITPTGKIIRPERWKYLDDKRIEQINSTDKIEIFIDGKKTVFVREGKKRKK